MEGRKKNGRASNKKNKEKLMKRIVKIWYFELIAEKLVIKKEK